MNSSCTTMTIMSAVDLAKQVLVSQLTDLNTVLHLPLLLLLYYVITSLVTSLTNHFTTDITKIPGPYIPPYQRYTVGHNILKHIILDNPVKTQHMYNNWRREHGEIFQLRSTLGERVIFITSERGMQEVNISKHSSFSKTSIARKTLGSLVGEQGILLAEGSRHSRLRRAVSPAMHHEALLTFGDTFLEQGALLANSLADRPVDDVLREVRLRTFAVIFETCFGKDAIPIEKMEKIQEAYLTVFLEPPMRSVVRILLSKFLWFVDKKRFQYRNDLKEYLNRTTFDLCKQNSGRTDRRTLLNLITDATTQKTLAYQEMVETVLSFLAAGQITTSISVCWTLYLLARHPEWQDRLVKELNNWSEDSGLAGLDELPLLNRIIREAIRLYPPVPSIGRTANEPVVINGYRLPKGAGIRMPIIVMQRSKEIWGDDSDEFNPDRFLKNGELSRTKMFWCSFLFGPRGCIGQRFALLEIKVFVAQILIRQRVYVKPMQDPPVEIVGVLCTPKNMMLYFEGRNRT